MELQNMLGRESSPYLRQHKDNPVHWQVWGGAALERARVENKPVLLSVGYAACHWCHVMAHESFENPQIAALMNEHFINIKLDREERPDLDSIYQSALGALGQQGGWPLTMFLTPDGEPFWGGTYFPPEPRFGRPGFPQLLMGVAEAYHNDGEKVRDNVTALRQRLDLLALPRGAGEVADSLVKQAGATALDQVDMLKGGLEGAPKFPQPGTFDFLWRRYLRGDDGDFAKAVQVTLDNICQGGIYDHLGGGFARYSTDDVWLVPHFEKMLYDNGLLLGLLTRVWRENGSPLYARRVKETVDWMNRDLWVEGPDGDSGAWAAALDADSEGVEGKYYVWSAQEIDDLLGDQAEDFKRFYGVRPDGNWEGANILHRLHAVDEPLDGREAAMTPLRDILLAHRQTRIPPGRDDKILADWNGIAITGLTEAAMAMGREDWLDQARKAMAFVTGQMTENGQLLHAWCDGQARHRAMLDDYANLALAALTLFEATGHDPYLDLARAWTAEADTNHWDLNSGGYTLAARDAEDVIAHAKPIHDNATPPGNGTMANVQARLFLLTGEDFHRERAESLLKLLVVDDAREAMHMGTLLNAHDLLQNPLQIVLIGAKDDPAMKAMVAAVFASPLPGRVLLQLNPKTEPPAGHPASGKTMMNGNPTAFICRGMSCGLPLTDVRVLKAELEKEG